MNRAAIANKFIFGLLIYQIFISIIINLLSKSNFYFVYSQLLSLLVPIVFYFFITKQKISDVLQIKKINAKNLFLLILLAFSIQPVMAFFSLVSSMFAENPTQNLIPIMLSKPLWLIILSSAILPAVFEEIVFRGIIFSGYKKIEWRKSFFINGLIFAAMHLNFQQFLYAMLMGIVFCTLVFYTQSIFSSILVHFIFNATQIIKTYLSVNSLMPTTIKNFSQKIFLSHMSHNQTIFIYGIIALIFLPISFLLLNFIIKDCKIEHNKNEGKEKILTLPLILYFSFAFFIMFFS